MRVVKAFAREERQLERFRDRVGARLRPVRCISTRLRAFYNPFIGFLPNLGLAAVLLVGGRQVIDGSLTLGDFTAFYAYLLMLISPMRMLGIALGMAQRATASGARAVRDPRPRAADRAAAPTRRRCPPAAGAVELRDVDARATRAARAGAARRRRSTSRPGSTVALVGATGSGKTTLVQLLAAPLRPRPRARVLIDGADVRDVDPRVAARARSRSSTTTPFLFSATRARQHRLRAAGRDARGGRARRRGARRRTASSRTCPTATTRASASAG